MVMRNKIYIAGPITGMTGEEVINYFDGTAEALEHIGYDVYQPMTAKGFFRNEVEFIPSGYQMPISTDRAIFGRDHWMVSMCDIFWANLLKGSERVSIGTVCELAWAFELRKHTILTLNKVNVHRHAFVLQMADIVFASEEETFDYLEKLSRMRA
jgi:nucleoside 2-deoxyribosyltransferase